MSPLAAISSPEPAENDGAPSGTPFGISKTSNGKILMFSMEFMNQLIRDGTEEECRVTSHVHPYLRPVIPLSLRGDGNAPRSSAVIQSQWWQRIS